MSPPASTEDAADLADPGPQEMTAFHWSTKDPGPGFGVEFTWDFGRGNDCVFLDATSSGPAASADDLNLYEFEDGTTGWGYGSSGDGLVSAHAGPLDTRAADDGGGGHASKGQAAVSGRFTYTWLLANAVADGSRYFHDPDTAAALSVTCVNPFRLMSANRLSIGLLLTDSNLDGGAGASAVFLAGTASGNVQDTASAEMAAPTVRLASGSFGTHAAVLAVETPDGRQEWQHMPTSPVAVGERPFFQDKSGPGRYSVTVDRAGADFEAFWFAAWGIDGPLDVAGSLARESAIDDPFDD